MKINGPVNVPPMTPITMSKRGRSSASTTARHTRVDRIKHRFKVKSREADKRSSKCWNKADVPIAFDMQSCKVTKRIVMYKGTLRGRISRTLAGVLLPYWQMAIMVVMAERLTVTGRILLRLKCRLEFNKIFT